jgi:hypothetical protein
VVPTSDTRGAAVPADPGASKRGNRSRFVAGGYEVPSWNEANLLRAVGAPRRRPSSRRPRGALGCGRPARRRTAQRTRAGPDDGDGDPEPGPRSGRHSLASPRSPRRDRRATS